jgi:hypothetical protein
MRTGVYVPSSDIGTYAMYISGPARMNPAGGERCDFMQSSPDLWDGWVPRGQWRRSAHG